MRISSLKDASSKYGIGFRIGMLNLVTVVFGLYSVKFISIPIFLTFRRCSLITTFAVSFLINNVPVTRWNLFKMGIVAVGSIIAGIDTFNKDYMGFFLIWMNNIS